MIANKKYSSKTDQASLSSTPSLYTYPKYTLHLSNEFLNSD